MIRPDPKGRLRTETHDPALSADLIASRIRHEISWRNLRDRRASALGQAAGVSAGTGTGSAAEPLDPAAAEGLPELRLQPVFRPRGDSVYHVNDLLRFHDADFLRNAYRALLERPPDPAGFGHYLDELRSARLSKIEILARLRFSPEGRARGVRVRGLLLPAAAARLGRLPILGYVIRWLVGWLRLPGRLHGEQEFEAYALAQQERIAEHVNESHGRLVRRLDEVSRQLAALQGLQADLAALRQELEASREAASRELVRVQAALGKLQSAVAFLEQVQDDAGRFQPLYAAFEEKFRGTKEQIRERLSFYLPLVTETGAGTAAAPVLDLGCGRGEWLELLRDSGCSATGVDLNEGMVARCRELGLDVAEGEAVETLQALPEAALGAVTGFHLIEHLRFDALIRLLDETVRVLRPGGLAIFETPDPRNVVVSSHTFQLDPTHRKPLPSELMTFLLEARGLREVRVLHLHPDETPPIAEDSEVARRFNEYFYGFRDYAVIGRKPQA